MTFLAVVDGFGAAGSIGPWVVEGRLPAVVEGFLRAAGSIGLWVVEGRLLAVVEGFLGAAGSIGLWVVEGFLGAVVEGLGAAGSKGLWVVEGGLVATAGLARLLGRGPPMALACFLACPRLIPWLTIRSLSTQKSRPWLFALFTVALYCPEFLKPYAGSAKYFEVDTGRPVRTALTDERLADVVGLVLDLGAVTLLTRGCCVLALGAWAFGALAFGPPEVGFAGFGLPFLAMAGTLATAMDNATAPAVRKRS